MWPRAKVYVPCSDLARWWSLEFGGGAAFSYISNIASHHQWSQFCPTSHNSTFGTAALFLFHVCLLFRCFHFLIANVPSFCALLQPAVTKQAFLLKSRKRLSENSNKSDKLKEWTTDSYVMRNLLYPKQSAFVLDSPWKHLKEQMMCGYICI